MNLEMYSSVGILLTALLNVGIATQPALAHQSFATALPSTDRLEKGLRQALETAFVPPKDYAPSATATSATRDPRRCHGQESRFHAIVPPGGYGLTLKQRPVITLEMAQTSAQRVALVVQDQSGKLHGSAFLPLSQSSDRSLSEAGQPGSDRARWVSFQVPDSIPPLMANQPYRWSLVVVCGELLQPDDPTFMGWVEYRETTSEMVQHLANASREQQADWYAKNGYWYDLVEQAIE